MHAELNPSHANPTAVTTAAITGALLIFTVNAFISLGAWQDGSWGMMFLIFVASPVANAVMARRRPGHHAHRKTRCGGRPSLALRCDDHRIAGLRRGVPVAVRLLHPCSRRLLNFWAPRAPPHSTECRRNVASVESRASASPLPKRVPLTRRFSVCPRKRMR